MAKPPKNIVTNKQNVNKAIEQFGQEKVNAAMAKQSAQGTNIVNTDTNTMVAGAGRYAGPDATGLNVVKTPVAAAPKPVTTPVATPEANMVSTAEAETQGNAILPESVTGIKSNVVITPAMQAKIDAKKNGVATTETAPVQPSDTASNQAKTELDTAMGEKKVLSDKKENAFNFYLKNSGQSEEQLKQTLKSAGYTDDEIAEKLKGIASSTKPEYNAVGPNGEIRAAIDPATGKPVETSDLEKQAQATGVEYTMENGQATYNPKTTEEATKILAMGGKLAGETKMSAVAQASLNKVRGLGQMTDQQLANNIAGGQVSNKELELLNTINPQLVAQAKELSKKKIITNTTNEIQADNSMIIKGEEPTGMSKPLQDLVNKLATIDADTKSPAEMKTAYQDTHPEMIQSRDQINALTTQKRDLQLAKMNLWKEWKAKNSSYPISMIMAGYSAASRDLDNSIYLINDDLNTEISNYNMYLDDMNAEIDFDIAQQGKEEQRLWDIYGVTSKEQIRNEDIAREDARIEQSIALEEQRYQRDIERDDMKSAQERKYKIEDMKNEMNMNIETGLMNLGVDPTGMTPEEMRATYARATQNQLAQQRALDYAKITKTADAGDGTPAPQFTPVFNEDGTMKISDSSVYNLAIGPDGNSVQVQGVVEGQIPPNGRGECGEFVNDLLGQRGIFGNKLSDKTKNINSNEPVVGGAFIEDVGPYGHVGFIESINEDESINIVDANYSNPPDKKIRRDTIAVGSPRWNQIKGFYDPSAGTIQQVDIGVWNSMTASERKKNQSNPQYQEFVDNYNRVMNDKDASIEEILRYSDGFKPLGDKESETLGKFDTVVQQLGDIQKQIAKNGGNWGDTGPILGRLRDMNPYDTDAQVLKAQLQGLIPGLARGVYGEVGVLTDQDIANYAKTIPNLKQTKDVNDAILAMTLKTVAGGYKKKLQGFAAAKNDVSGFRGVYDDLLARAKEIEDRLGISSSAGGSFQPTKTDVREEDSELDSLRGGGSSSYTIGGGTGLNINKSTPGLTFIN